MSFSMTGSGAVGSAATGSLGQSITLVTGESVIVVCYGAQWFTGTVLTVSDGTNTYSAVMTGLNNGNGTTDAIQLFKADNVVGGTYTLTVTDNHSSICGVAFYRYTGLASGAALATSTLNASSGGSGGPNNCSLGAITPPSQPGMLFAAVINPSTTQPTAGTTLAFNDRSAVMSAITLHGCAAEDWAVNALTSVTMTFSLTSTFQTVLGQAALFALAPTAQFYPLETTLHV